jgi:hypothetical protein
MLYCALGEKNNTIINYPKEGADSKLVNLAYYCNLPP